MLNFFTTMNGDETPKALLRERIKGLQERNRELEELHSSMMAQLIQGQKLQALGQLSAAIAHEVSNPLNYVLANLSILQKHVEIVAQICTGQAAKARIKEIEEVLEQMRQSIAESREGGARMLDLVKNLKEFSRVDDADLQETDLHRVLESAIRLCWNDLKHKAQLERKFGSIPPIRCHPQRLSQVFVNLLMNACHAIEEKGRGLGTVTITTSMSGVEALVEVRDTGVGISEETLAHLFQPFYTTKPMGKGMGLGLYVAQRIVDAHRGHIEAHSVPGQGTSFIVRLRVR